MPHGKIEEIILQHGCRGMDRVAAKCPSGYCLRAAQLILKNRGRVLIGTGFPVNNSYETDGPVGAISLFNVLKQLGYEPLLVCAPPISQSLIPSYDVYEIPILPWQATIPVVTKALGELEPALVISVERPGIAADGCYYNMRGEEITAFAAKYDLFFEHSRCPTIAFGDGGNEIGMGNVKDLLEELPITPSITTCNQLVLATVSNWGVYGVIKAMELLLGDDLFKLFDPRKIMAYLLENGSVDGVTLRSENSEDGFPIETGLGIIKELQALSVLDIHAI